MFVLQVLASLLICQLFRVLGWLLFGIRVDFLVVISGGQRL